MSDKARNKVGVTLDIYPPKLHHPDTFYCKISIRNLTEIRRLSSQTKSISGYCGINT